MSKIDTATTWRRMQHHYRLIILNDDTLEEVTAFKLSRLRLYIVMSIMFIFMVAFTVALLVLTPLKFYIPGYGTAENRSTLQALKLRTDSLQQAIEYREVYIQDLKAVLNSSMPQNRDTTSLKIKK